MAVGEGAETPDITDPRILIPNCRDVVPSKSLGSKVPGQALPGSTPCPEREATLTILWEGGGKLFAPTVLSGSL